MRQAYDRKREREDWPLAVIAWLVVNFQRGEDQDAFTLEQVLELLGHRQPEPPPTVEDLASKIEVLNQLYEGQDLRRNGQR